MATPILPIEKACQLLGGRNVLGREPRSHMQLIPLLEKGFLIELSRR